MTFDAADQIEHFLSRLELKLKLPKHRKQEIIDELRSELISQKEAHVAGGYSEQEAEKLVLESADDPDRLAEEMSATVAPTSGGAVRIVRYVVAAGIILWALMLLWTMRAWTYGFSPLITGGILALHLSPILIIWPGIIWRKNWLFGLIPAGVCVAFLLAINTAGVSSSTVIDLDAPADLNLGSEELPDDNGRLLLSAFVGIAVFLIAAIQRRRQRWRVIAVALLVFGSIESIYLLEEKIFRDDRDRLLLAFRNGEMPTQPGVRINEGGEGLSLFWKRKLCPGFSIAYSTASDKVWIND